jgi:hypothetical protein
VPLQSVLRSSSPVAASLSAACSSRTLLLSAPLRLSLALKSWPELLML